ncbi:MAG TPA: hypothetical protein QGF58_11160 [Myxococcota bacterium]|nr:hypothetical protein [Myxococcota bacterium]
MFGFALKADGFFSRTRPGWVGLGQLAVAALGVHLAADRLDDHVLQGLLRLNEHLFSTIAVKLSLGGIEPDAFVSPAVWLALLIELAVDLYMFFAIALTAQDPELDWKGYRRKLSVEAVVLPLFWAPVALAGSWVVGMAVEDKLAAWHPGAAMVLGWTIAGLVGWRLAWTGWKRIVGGLDVPKRRTKGIVWAPALLLFAALAAWHGLPVHGVLP